jgi:8-oxo-dGTP diphosphatase/A/G-specific adenine glycosylase
MSQPRKRIDAAIAVVFRGSKILLCQRKDDDAFGGYWEFPGGKLEPGETLEQCLSRELREEINIEARPARALPVIEHDYPHLLVRLHPFLCEHVAGEPALIECQHAIWINPAELRNYRLPPANQQLIEQVIQHFATASSAKSGPAR